MVDMKIIMDVRKDLIFVLILLGLKLFIIKDMSWWLVFAPLIIGFVYNFAKGFINGIKDGHEDREDK